MHHISIASHSRRQEPKRKKAGVVYLFTAVSFCHSAVCFFSSYKCRLFNLFLVCSHLFDKHNSKELWSTYYSWSTCWSKFFSVLTRAFVKLKFTSITAWSWIPVKKCNALLSWLLRFLFLDRTHFCHEGEVRVRQSWGVLTTNNTNPTLFEICIWWLNANSTKHWSIYKSWFKYPWAKGLLVVILFYVWVNFSCEPVHLGISNAFSLCVKLADRPNLVCLSKHID